MTVVYNLVGDMLFYRSPNVGKGLEILKFAKAEVHGHDIKMMNHIYAIIQKWALYWKAVAQKNNNHQMALANAGTLLYEIGRNKEAKNRQPLQQANHPNHIWGMDFVSDALFDGRRLRLLTIIDRFTRESLGIVVGQSLKGHDVQEALTAIARFRGNPEVLKTDNGSEFAGKVMDRWAYERNIEIDFSRPGKPTDNATVESFNGRLRQECLNENWFLSLADAREKIEAWRTFYNQVRPHSALEWSTPSDYARKHAVSRKKQKQLEPDFSNSGWT